jgi:hypothetical protein
MTVGSGVDLVDVAYALEQDDVERVKQWTESKQLLPVSDQQARDWVNRDASLWAVVIKPWVLVQEPD